jgi:hypothetical protein
MVAIYGDDCPLASRVRRSPVVGWRRDRSRVLAGLAAPLWRRYRAAQDA